MTPTTLLLGADGGGTGCRARLCDLTGRILGEGASGPANIRFGVEGAFAAVRDAAVQCLANSGLGAGEAGRIIACLGFAGATEPAGLAAAQGHPHPFRAALVVADAHIACIGAHEGRNGGVVVVGTGTCGWAVLDGQPHRVGGWGFPVSDEGSGAWIGGEALRRALWAGDGRMPWTPVLRALFDQFGGDPHQIVAWMTGAKPGDFGSLAPLVVEHAGRGDPVAAELMDLAGRHVDALAQRLLGLGAPALALVGGLAPFIEARLSPEVRARLVAPAEDALGGALRLARAEARRLGFG